MAKEALKLNTGLKTVPIYLEDRDETIEIKFNPTDSELPNRLQTAFEKIQEIAKPFEGEELDENGEPKNEAILGKFREVSETIKVEVDKAFGSKISKEIFKYCGALSPVDGDYYICNFFNVILPYIQKQYETERSKQTKKYLDKYGK